MKISRFVLIPSIKYWIFDQHQLRMEHLEHINLTGWDQLLQSRDQYIGFIPMDGHISEN
ncbi:MAG: hypothetical protein ACRC8A_17625 [Microcoleaceae cyanobacterium]